MLKLVGLFWLLIELQGEEPNGTPENISSYLACRRHLGPVIKPILPLTSDCLAGKRREKIEAYFTAQPVH